MWYNKYVGTPYKDKGRTLEGADCWGLVRLIYDLEYNISLPSFDQDYPIGDTPRIAELMSQYVEGWKATRTPEPGNVVMFRILGHVSHIGVMISETKFIHNSRKQAASIESIDNPKWSKRIEGFYKYTTEAAETLKELPISLKAKPIEVEVPEGTTIQHIIDAVALNEKLPKKLKSQIILFIDGEQCTLPPETVLEVGQKLEYRLLPKDNNTLRTIAVIAVVIVATVLTAPAGGTGGSIAAGWFGATTATGVALANAAVYAGTMLVGMALVNQIFPTRPPDPIADNTADPGSSNPQLMLTGSRNESRVYSAIPVVLGKYRIVAPVAASNYVEMNTDTSFLRMLLCWGYGPVTIEDMRVGATPISSYDEVTMATCYGNVGESLAPLYSIYGNDTYQLAPNLELTYTEPSGDSAVDYISRVITNKSTKLSVQLHFPQGLRGIYREGSSAGQAFAATFRGTVQIRKLNESLNPIGSWISPGREIQSNTFTLPLWYNLVLDMPSSPFGPNGDLGKYRWHRIVQYSTGQVTVLSGPIFANSSDTTTPTSTTTGSAGGWLSAAGGIATYSPTLPALPQGCRSIYDIKAYNSGIVSVVDNRSTIFTGCTLTYTGLQVTLASGINTTVATTGTNIFYGASNEPFYLRKDAFTSTIVFEGLDRAPYEVRIKRDNSALFDFDTTANKPYYYHKAVFYLVSAVDGGVNPVTPPPNTGLALTAINIKATDQLNGSIEGINALVSSICLDYYGGSWVAKTTNNPASLFRYLLQHPANAQKITDAEVSTRIDIPNLEDWHTYCTTNGFAYDGVITEHRSLLEVLRDVCAAGRASPILIGGKWSVVIDRERTDIIQHFTPQNSWGFEGSKQLSIQPHALRVTFINSEKEYQSEELIVYNDGYDESNASVFEAITLPGVTIPNIVYKQARFHLAQAKLRPEAYSINVDIEHLACTRGDLVRVTHDIPMWGVGSCRIKNWVSTSAAGTVLELDNELQLNAGTSYVIRIRTETGASIVRNVVPVTTSNYYSTIKILPETNIFLAAPDNLVMFGYPNTESAEHIVLGVEPFNNLSAKISLTDYSPAIYTADSQPIPPFNTNISRAPYFARNYVTSTPVVTGIRSDESVMELSGAAYIYKVSISYSNNVLTETNITHVECRMCLTSDLSKSWRFNTKVLISESTIIFSDVIEQETYSIQLRYYSGAGYVGPWTDEVTHKIVGRTTKPADVATFNIAGDKLSWTAVDAVDLSGYVIRYHYGTNYDWNTGVALHTGVVTDSPFVMQNRPSGVVTIMIKAEDSIGLQSESTANIITDLGDPITSNIVETIDFKAQHFPGTLTNCTNVADVLLAAAATSFYGEGPASFYGPGFDSFYQDSSFAQMVYTTPEFYMSNSLENISGIIELDYEGTDAIVEYRLIGPNPFYAPGPFYGPGTDSFYGPPTDWLPCPAALEMTRNYYQFRVTIGAGHTQGKLKQFKILLDVDDVIEYINDIAISNLGTVVPYTKTFNSIKNVQVTLQANASGAVTVEVDKTIPMSPKIKAYNSAHTAVSGATADITIKGY